MEIISAPPKTRQITDILIHEIRDGNIPPGARLDSIRKMANKFSVSNKIIECVFDALEKENLIIRKPGSGTFVKNWEEESQSDVIGVITESTSISYESYFHDMTKAFSQNGKLCLPIQWYYASMDSRNSLRQLMKQKPASLIIDIGFSHSLEEIFAITKKTKKCLIGFRNPQEPRDCPAVFIDHISMFAEGLEFLFGRGHNKILIIGHNLDLLPTHQLILEEATKRLGLEFPCERLLYASMGDFGTDYEERIRKIFNSDNPPTAVFGFSDSVVWKFTQDLKLLYPQFQFSDQLGIYNTEWSRHQGKEFHTFDIPNDKIFNKAIKILNKQINKSVINWIKPDIIIREKE